MVTPRFKRLPPPYDYDEPVDTCQNAPYCPLGNINCPNYSGPDRRRSRLSDEQFDELVRLANMSRKARSAWMIVAGFAGVVTVLLQWDSIISFLRGR